MVHPGGKDSLGNGAPPVAPGCPASSRREEKMAHLLAENVLCHMLSMPLSNTNVMDYKLKYKKIEHYRNDTSALFLNS